MEDTLPPNYVSLRMLQQLRLKEKQEEEERQKKLQEEEERELQKLKDEEEKKRREEERKIWDLQRAEVRISNRPPLRRAEGNKVWERVESSRVETNLERPKRIWKNRRERKAERDEMLKEKHVLVKSRVESEEGLRGEMEVRIGSMTIDFEREVEEGDGSMVEMKGGGGFGRRGFGNGWGGRRGNESMVEINGDGNVSMAEMSGDRSTDRVRRGGFRRRGFGGWRGGRRGGNESRVEMSGNEIVSTDEMIGNGNVLMVEMSGNRSMVEMNGSRRGGLRGLGARGFGYGGRGGRRGRKECRDEMNLETSRNGNVATNDMNGNELTAEMDGSGNVWKAEMNGNGNGNVSKAEVNGNGKGNGNGSTVEMSGGSRRGFGYGGRGRRDMNEWRAEMNHSHEGFGRRFGNGGRGGRDGNVMWVKREEIEDGGRSWFTPKY